MKRKEFSIQIDAPREKVWSILWDNETYATWTAPFFEGSHIETTWEEGSDAKFLGPDKNGILSKIVKKVPYHTMYFKHQGVIEKRIPDLDHEEAQQWKGAIENYTLTEHDGSTRLHIETDIASPYLEAFLKIWPKALQCVKELSEV